MGRRLGSSLFGAVLVGAVLLVPIVALGQPRSDEVQEVIAAENERFRALAEQDMETAEMLHAEEFVQVNPYGHEMRRQDLLGAVASGSLDFVNRSTASVQVRVYGDAAVLKQHELITAVVDGGDPETLPLWTVALYERRDGVWQVVWVIASETRFGPDVN